MCGCGNWVPSEEEIEEAIRQAEEEREGQPVVIEEDDAPIPVDWPARQPAEVE